MSRDVETRHGPARIHVHGVPDARGVLFLGHGAGGGVGAPDIVAAMNAALDERVSVVLVEQPYRVAGRRSPAPAHQLDAAWIDVLQSFDSELPLVAGGRSSGARVACRTAAGVGAVGVICLAFPLQPPGRPHARSRLPELELVRVPVLVVQGENDAFGMPPRSKLRKVVRVGGDHSLRSDPGAVAAAVRGWLVGVVG